LRGRISQGFDLRSHAAIDIVPGIDESVKAVMDGTIVFSGWTPDNGFCINIQHTDNWVSSYKHNSVLYKKQGDVVKVGETIAIAGSSGEQSTGVHLHFELWHNGNSVNPLSYIPF
jgi:murein DD-endopeptidase MepM/ murein hydrolase activator NlpD